MVAVNHGRIDIIDMLVAEGADVFIRDGDGNYTARKLAKLNGFVKTEQRLSEHESAAKKFTK